MTTFQQSTHEVQERDAGWRRLDALARAAAESNSDARISYDEFMDWADEDTLAEWVDGKVVMSSPASLRHQLINIFLTSVITTYAAVFDLGIVLNAPFQMRLPRSGREPDVIFIEKEHLDRLRRTALHGPVDLVVELISPESVERDRVTKLSEYQAASVPEYWLIDTDARTATFYQLDAAGVYALVSPDAQGVYHARSLRNFWLDVAWLWRDPLPGVEQTVLTVAGEAYARYLLARLADHGFLPHTP